MKVNELQIGDYVNYRGQIIKVTSLYDKGSSNEIGWGIKEDTWVNAINIEPIPLTAEILEKNGFKLDKEDGWWWLSPKIGITFWEEGDIELELENKHSSVNIHINYLHQLQHVIRICGIEKTIEL